MGGNIYTICSSCGKSYSTDNRVVFVLDEHAKETGERICTRCQDKKRKR